MVLVITWCSRIRHGKEQPRKDGGLLLLLLIILAQMSIVPGKQMYDGTTITKFIS